MSAAEFTWMFSVFRMRLVLRLGWRHSRRINMQTFSILSLPGALAGRSNLSQKCILISKPQAASISPRGTVESSMPSACLPQMILPRKLRGLPDALRDTGPGSRITHMTRACPAPGARRPSHALFVSPLQQYIDQTNTYGSKLTAPLRRPPRSMALR